MANAISMQDLENAKVDVDHIAEVATSLGNTATDRLGHVKQTLAGAVGSIAAITDRGAWATGAAYLVKDLVTVEGIVYVCVLGHTAGATFAGDAAKWRVYQGLTVAEFDDFVAGLASKLKEVISILDFGGSGDGTFDNTSALSLARALGKSSLSFPRDGSNNYYFGSAVSSVTTSDLIFDVEEGVTISSPDAGFISGDCRVVRPTRFYYTLLSAERYVYPERNHSERKTRAVKNVALLEDYDAERRLVSRASTAALVLAKTPYLTNAFTTASGSVTADSVSLAPNVSTGDLYGAFKPVSSGDSLTCFFDSVAGSLHIAAAIRTVDGLYGLWCGTEDAAIPRYFEYYNATGSEAQTTYHGAGTHPQYCGYKSLWTIRVTSQKSCDVLFNGTVIAGINTASEIIDAGFGMRPYNTSASVKINGWYFESGTKKAGLSPVRLAIFGDSRTSYSMPDTWPRWLVDYLDGSDGLRIHNINNFAVAGASSADQLALCTPSNISTSDIVIIDIGTNDIQGNVATETFSANLSAMVAVCVAAHKSVILGVPDMFYSQTQSGGSGQGTTYTDAGRAIRAEVLSIAVANGCQVVNKMELLGPILGNYVNGSIENTLVGLQTDPIVYDNVHFTTLGQQLIAKAYAKSILGAIKKKSGLEVLDADLPSGLVSNGWSFIGSGIYNRDSSGTVTLYAAVSAGTKTDGTVIYTLPRAIWPKRTIRVPVFADGGVQVNLNIAREDGTVAIVGASGWAGSYISFDGVRFPTK